MERANGILRQLDAHLRRKSLTFAKAWRWFRAKLNLTVAYYNLIRPHGTLSRNPDRHHHTQDSGHAGRPGLKTMDLGRYPVERIFVQWLVDITGQGEELPFNTTCPQRSQS